MNTDKSTRIARPVTRASSPCQTIFPHKYCTNPLYYQCLSVFICGNNSSPRPLRLCGESFFSFLGGSMIRFLVLLTLAASTCTAQSAPAPDKVGKLPHIEFSAKTKQIKIECEMLACNAPLEFFCCVKGTNDYESMIRSEVKPSDLHTALLAVGMQPGQP